MQHASAMNFSSLPQPRPVRGPIGAAGVYQISARHYHTDPLPEPSLSASIGVLALGESPAHAQARHPRLTDCPDLIFSKAMDRGSAQHELLLGGEPRVVTVDAADWRTKDARAERDRIRTAGGVPVLAADWPRMAKMLAAARVQLAERGMGWAFSPARGFAEIAFVWQEQTRAGPIWSRALLDWLDPDTGLILDYKTTALPLARWKRNARFELAGRFQPAWYRRAAGRLGIARPRFVYAVQQVQPPFALMLVEPGRSLLDSGRGDVDKAALLWRRCLDRAEWPAYPPKVETLDGPKPAGRRGRSHPPKLARLPRVWR